jgi:hypothetical protein
VADQGRYAFAGPRQPGHPPLPAALPAVCAGDAGPGGNVPLSPAQCFARHGYTQWTTYQPASRFWPVQFIEAGWLLALSVLLIAATILLARRRAA